MEKGNRQSKKDQGNVKAGWKFAVNVMKTEFCTGVESKFIAIIDASEIEKGRKYTGKNKNG